MPNMSREEFVGFVAEERARSRESGHAREPLWVPLSVRLLSDQLTPVLAYRRLVSADERQAPSFLLESVEGGERQGRYSILGAQPILEVIAHRDEVSIESHGTVHPGAMRLPRSEARSGADPLAVMRSITAGGRLAAPPRRGARPLLPSCFLGGWVGFAGYDSVRYTEPEKLAWKHAPTDDRDLPDVHFGLYDGVVVFDHAEKLISVVKLAEVRDDAEAGVVYDSTIAVLRNRVSQLERHSKPLASGLFEREEHKPRTLPGGLGRDRHAAMIDKAMEYIRAGDIFQVVLGQRFERASKADPFDVYRALRAVNPSPYMVYMQGRGTILVASSPEILCRVRREELVKSADRAAGTRLIVTNRPLAGTRSRGLSPEADRAMELDLLSDEKERAEHIMLVDLGRNDVGRVAVAGSISTPSLMEIERYSHVMHISSTVTGELREGLDCWDALRTALPVGTISGAPKIRAMEIIDELEPLRRGPYGGGMGYVGLDGQMDIALTLRTMVVPTSLKRGSEWMYHLQASGGIVADSSAEAEYQETVNKAAALARAIDVAERAFG